MRLAPWERKINEMLQVNWPHLPTRWVLRRLLGIVYCFSQGKLCSLRHIETPYMHKSSLFRQDEWWLASLKCWVIMDLGLRLYLTPGALVNDINN